MLLETDKYKIGQIFKKYRKLMKLTQFELAEKIGLNEKQISRIEAGLNYPTYMTFSKIINVLAINIADFDTETQQPNNNYHTTLINLIKTSDEDELKMYINVIKAMKKNIKNIKK